LQSIFTGNDFDYYDDTGFKTSHEGNMHKISVENRHKQKRYIRSCADKRRALIQELWVHDESFKIIAMNISGVSDQQRKLHVEYADFIEIESQLFSKREKFELFMQQPGKNYKTKITLDYSRIELNKEVATPFNIPEKYTRIAL
jgi:hypothetical protein